MEVSKYLLYGKKPLLKAGSEYEFWMDKLESGYNPYSFTGTELIWVWKGQNDPSGVRMDQVY